MKTKGTHEPDQLQQPFPAQITVAPGPLPVQGAVVVGVCAGVQTAVAVAGGTSATTTKRRSQMADHLHG